MSTNPQTAPESDAFGFLNEMPDEAFNVGNTPEPYTSFPYGWVYADKENRGRNGGLFVPLDIAPPDTKFAEKMTPIELSFNGELTSGRVSKNYSLIVLGFDHDEQGRPKVWKEERSGKWVFSVLCCIAEAYSATMPFRIRYKGKINPWRVANMIRDFDKLVIQKANELRKKKDPNAKPIPRHFFRIPISHMPEHVGTGQNMSWACPPQDLVLETISKDSKGFRTGISVFKKYSDDPRLILEDKLIIQSRDNIMKWTEWIKEYAEEAVSLIGNNGPAGGSDEPGAGGDFFVNGDEKAPTQPMKEFIDKLLKAAHIEDADGEIRYCIGANILAGPQDAKAVDLTFEGARKFIDYLKTKKEDVRPQKADDSIPSGGQPSPITDDDMPWN